MDSVSIEYQIKLGEHRVETFRFRLDGRTFDLIKGETREPAVWTKLSFSQCPHCPLSPARHSHCPMALELQDIVERFQDTRSIDRVELEVVTEERRVLQSLDIQRAIASMLDLVLPTCGCPKTEHLRPLARFHLPLASEEETVFRVTGMFLLAQYFLSQQSPQAGISLDGLIALYQDFHVLNKAIAGRLQEATHSDSVKNAFALVDVYSVLVPLLVEDRLVEMRGFFSSYLPELGKAPIQQTHLDKAKAFKLELVPLEGEETSPDEPPSWLGGAGRRTESGPKGAESPGETPVEQLSVADQILSKSGLKLELEPIPGKADEDRE